MFEVRWTDQLKNGHILTEGKLNYYCMCQVPRNNAEDVKQHRACFQVKFCIHQIIVGCKEERFFKRITSKIAAILGIYLILLLSFQAIVVVN